MARPEGLSPLVRAEAPFAVGGHPGTLAWRYFDARIAGDKRIDAAGFGLPAA
jgi:hypothetical protein